MGNSKTSTSAKTAATKTAAKGAKAARGADKGKGSRFAFIKDALLGKKKAEPKKVVTKGTSKAMPKKAAPAPKIAAEKPGKTAKTSANKQAVAPAKKGAGKNPGGIAVTALGVAVGVGKKSVAVARVAVSRTQDAESVCREVACEGLSTTAGYCRLHYIKNWKKIKRKELILKEKKLNRYIEELVAKYPDKYIEAIRQDLANDKDFAKVISDLDLDEAVDEFDTEGESPEALIDTIKRDFEDEGEGF